MVRLIIGETGGNAMRQPDQAPEPKVSQQKAASKPDPLQPQEAPGDVPDFVEEYTTIGVDKTFWKEPFVEVEKDRETHKQYRVI